MLSKFGFQFDKVIVIESLPEYENAERGGEIMSSGEYYSKIFFPYINSIRPNAIEFELRKVNSSEELLTCLDEKHCLKQLKITLCCTMLKY